MDTNTCNVMIARIVDCDGLIVHGDEYMCNMLKLCFLNEFQIQFSQKAYKLQLYLISLCKGNVRWMFNIIIRTSYSIRTFILNLKKNIYSRCLVCLVHYRKLHIPICSLIRLSDITFKYPMHIN